MTEERKFYIFLSQFDITPTKCKQIIEAQGGKIDLTTFKKTKFDKILSSEDYQKMVDSLDEGLLSGYVFNLEDKEIKIATFADEEYPQKLRQLPEAPYIIYYRGDINLLNLPTIAIVGTRKPTAYGRSITQKLASQLAGAGIVIVSGLAYGVDSLAHRACLEAGGKTVAVLSAGFDYIYPSEHQGLAEEIAQSGLLISEQRPKRKVDKYLFPIRNRIIAGLSEGVLITEAGSKSGTIHTREFALEYGKNIYAVPGNINSSASELTNEAIRAGYASCVLEVGDILKDYDVSPKKSQKIEGIQLSFEEESIVSALRDGEMTIEELAKRTLLPINIFNSCLTTLEINGIINRIHGGKIALN